MPHFGFFLDFLFPPLPLRCAHCVKRRFLLSVQSQPYSFSTVTVMLLQLCWRNQVGGGGGRWLGKRNLLFAHKYFGAIRRKTRSEQHALYKKKESWHCYCFPPCFFQSLPSCLRNATRMVYLLSLGSSNLSKAALTHWMHPQCIHSARVNTSANPFIWLYPLVASRQLSPALAMKNPHQYVILTTH